MYQVAHLYNDCFRRTRPADHQLGCDGDCMAVWRRSTIDCCVRINKEQTCCARFSTLLLNYCPNQFITRETARSTCRHKRTLCCLARESQGALVWCSIESLFMLLPKNIGWRAVDAIELRGAGRFGTLFQQSTTL